MPVSGRLTYEDGTPIPAGGIRLGFHRAGRAGPTGRRISAAGAKRWSTLRAIFPACTSYRPGDGLIPGKHKVAIFYATDAKGKLLIPKEFAHPSTTPLVIDTADAPLEIKVPKP